MLARRVKRRVSWILDFEGNMQRAIPRFDPRLEDIYLKRGILLIHVPKCAGSSVEQALYGDVRIHHRTWQELSRDYPEAWEKCTKIAVVREPVSRFLSAYNYLRLGGRNEYDLNFSRRYIRGKSAEQLAALIDRDIHFRKRAMSFFHFRPQSDFVANGSQIMVDELIPMERLWPRLERHGVTQPIHKNQTRSAAATVRDLSPQTASQIRSLYARDCELHEIAMGSEGGDRDLERMTESR
jgi:hypothetical protein